jgi:hypothetical protein
VVSLGVMMAGNRVSDGVAYDGSTGCAKLSTVDSSFNGVGEQGHGVAVARESGHG